MKRFVLAYHSHRVLGDDYARNDHVALFTDLRTIDAHGGRIVPLAVIVDAVSGDVDGRIGDAAAEVAITFDDGPMYDAVDFVHPRFGAQRGFLGILRDFAAEVGARTQPSPCATSFVIASPEARQCMERTYDRAHSYVGYGALNDDWWNEAIASGLLSIANHSWDHLHEGLPAVAHSANARGVFARVTTPQDADAQIARAADYLARRTQGRDAPFFAYPYGHYNRFLVDEYLPANATRLRLRAAFTTDPKPIAAGDNPWCLPRYVCGHHWTSPDALREILDR
ncbi:MAG TPA: polysaccharide deacetylase family protein [Casimicrobiaceae bacterium]